MNFRKFVPMKRIIVIFLLLQIVSNNAFAEELVKMPKLFTHFYHHAREHKDAGNFMDYLHKHYSDHHENDRHSKGHSGEDNDCNLPFKHCDNCCVNAHAPAGFTVSYLTTNYNLFQSGFSIFVFEDDRIESQDLCSIWQPPKLA
jgi:hypothetical protein